MIERALRFAALVVGMTIGYLCYLTVLIFVVKWWLDALAPYLQR